MFFYNKIPATRAASFITIIFLQCGDKDLKVQT